MSVVDFAVVDNLGRVLWVGQSPRSVALLQDPGPARSVVILEDGNSDVSSESHWWDGSSFLIRPTIGPLDKSKILANGIEKSTVTGLPVPCTVHVDGSPYVIDDGSFEFSTDTRGVYVIEVDHFPYLPFRAEVKAV